MIAVEFNNNNVDNSRLLNHLNFQSCKISSWNFFFRDENIHSFGKNVDKIHSFAFELNRSADIVLSETCFSANTCHDVQAYTGFHT